MIESLRLRLQPIGRLAARHVEVVVVGGILLALYLGLGSAYVLTLSQQSALQRTVDRLSGIAGSAPTNAADIQAQYEALQERLPGPDLMETDVFRTMTAEAMAEGINPESFNIELQSTNPSAMVGEEEYRTLTFAITVEGERERVRDYVQRLDRGETPLKTLVMESVSLESGETSRATMNVKVYAEAAP